jgi:outer membrane protein OmpA-like peptidoglycan-associated protein
MNGSNFRFLLLAAGLASQLCSMQAAFGQVQKFQSSWEQSRWQVEAGPRHCALTHDIPRFGQVRFEQQSGKRLNFSLHVDIPPVRDQEARLHAEAPPWKFPRESYALGDFRLKHGKTPLRLPRDQALRIYYELEQGMQPVISFSDWGDSRDQVQVALMPVRFREVLPEFLACTANLLYLDFEPIAEQTVYFVTNSDRLSRGTRRVLEGIARKYRKNSEFRIVLGGHADERGASGYNMKLSNRRAKMVSRYLNSRGIPKQVIELRAFGETEPKNPESSQDAWASNRRVTIWLAEKG